MVGAAADLAARWIVSEPREIYQVHEALTTELLVLLSPGQIAMLLTLLKQARENGYGEVRLLIEGKRLLLVKQESYDGGKMPNWPKSP